MITKFSQTNILLFIILIGLILRIYAINQHDFWFDEAFAYQIAKLPLRDLFNAVTTDNNPPLYYIILHIVTKFSSQQFWLRFPSLFFNLATIPVLFFICRKSFKHGTGLVASALFSFSPLPIYIATETRLHAMGTFLSVVIIWAFFVFQRKSKTFSAITFTILSILGIYTHYYIFLLFIPFSILIIRNPSKLHLKRWFLICATTILSFVPWMFFSFQSNHNQCACPNTVISLPATLVSPILGGVGLVTLRSFPDLPVSIFYFFAFTAIFNLILFVLGVFRKKNLLVIYMIPLLILSIFGIFEQVFSPKGFVIFSPIYFIILASGLLHFKKSFKFILITLVPILIVSIIELTHPFFAGEKLKQVSEITNKNQDIPIAHTSLMTYYSLNYYNHGQQNFLITTNPLISDTLKYIGGRKQEISITTYSFWLVDSNKWVDKKERKEALNKIYRQFSVEKSISIDNITVNYLIRKNNAY